MDRIMQTEFKKRLPGMIAQTIIGAVARAAVQYELQRKGGLAGALIGGVYQGMTANLDTRFWLGLPKAWYAVRIPKPADGRITVLTARGNPVREITLPPSQFNIVSVRMPTAQAAAAISIASFVLPSETATATASTSRNQNHGN
jgi:hypothetical protein